NNLFFYIINLFYVNLGFLKKCVIKNKKHAAERGVLDCLLFLAGCGVNALSGLQKHANSIYCRDHVGLISVAHQAI
ncbi:hypothetical protein AB9B80_11900, partial [Escherichia coli]